MSNGHGNQNNLGQQLWVRPGPSGIITPEQYRHNQMQIAQARERLQQMERANEQGLRLYSAAEQELRNRVEQGREAERILAQIHSQTLDQPSSTSILTAPPANGIPPGHPAGPHHVTNYGNPAPIENATHTSMFVQGSSRNAIPGPSQPLNYGSPMSVDALQPVHAPYGSRQNMQYQQDHRSNGYTQPHNVAQSASSSQTNLPSGDSRKRPSNPTQPNGSRHVAEAQGARAQPTAHGQTANTAETHTTPEVDLKEAVKQAERRIYELAKAIPRDTVIIVFKMVILRFRNRMITLDGEPLKLTGLGSEQNSITPGMIRMCDIVAAVVQNFTGPVILRILSNVRLQIFPNPQPTTYISMPSASPSTGAVPATQPAAPSASTAGNSIPQQSSRPQDPQPQQGPPKPQALPQQPPQETHPPRFIEVHPAGSNGIIPATPHSSRTDITNTSFASTREGQENAPSVSFSNLPQHTPIRNGVRPPWTPGRLAFDILNSLGRPSGRTPVVSKDDGTANGKRKRSSLAEEDVEKRQKVGEADAVGTAPALPAAEANKDTSSVVVEPPPAVVPAAPQDPPSPPAPVALTEDHAAPPEPVAAVEDHASSEAEDDNVTIVEEPEEIQTPGVIESALNEVAAAMHRGLTGQSLQEPSSPILDAPSIQANGISSPVATPPPSSKSSSPSRGVHHSEEDIDMVDAQLESHPSTAAPSTPVAGPSKQPLFYVSPTASDEDFPARENFDEDAMSDFMPSGLLDGHAPMSPRKGKQRASEEEDDDDDDEIEVVEDVLSIDEVDSADSRISSEAAFTADESETMHRKAAKKVAKRAANRMYVLVPPPSAALREMQIRAGKAQIKSRIVHRVVVSSDDESDVDEIAEDFRDEATQQKEATEARAIQGVCYGRLTAYKCRWKNCDAVLESAKRLGTHARTHALDYDDDASLVCCWEECPREYTNQEKLQHHVQKHSLHPVVCARAGCDFECWYARDMVRHYNQPKHRGQALKPEAGPVAPDLSIELFPMPETLPAYMSISRPVRPARISPERHATLAPKIATNLSTWAPVSDDESEGTVLRTPRRPKLSDKLKAASVEGGDTRKARQGPYDHWLLQTRAAAKVRRLCDDIPSRAVTEMFASGAVIDNEWLAKGDPDWEYPDEDADADGVTDREDEEVQSVDGIRSGGLEEDRGGDAVAGMEGESSNVGELSDGASAVVEEELHGNE